MRAEYRSVCVKFRTDDALQMRAWGLLCSRARAEKKSYSRVIAEALAGNTDLNEESDADTGYIEEMLREIRADIKGIETLLSESSQQEMRGGERAKLSELEGQDKSRPAVKDTVAAEEMSSALMSFAMDVDEDD